MSTNTILNFCDKCNNIMSYREVENSDGEKSLELHCSSCKFSKSAKNAQGGPLRGVILSMKHGTHLKLPLNEALQYDTTQRLTKHVSCANKDCVSNDVSKWGMLQSGGAPVIIQPDVMMANYFDENRILTYICHMCGHMWKHK